MQEKQRIASAENDDADVFGYHYENGMLAVNLFHMRGGKIVDRRDFFWEDLPEISDSVAERGDRRVKLPIRACRPETELAEVARCRRHAPLRPNSCASMPSRPPSSPPC